MLDEDGVTELLWVLMAWIMPIGGAVVSGTLLVFMAAHVITPNLFWILIPVVVGVVPFLCWVVFLALMLWWCNRGTSSRQ